MSSALIGGSGTAYHETLTGKTAQNPEDSEFVYGDGLEHLAVAGVRERAERVADKTEGRHLTDGVGLYDHLHDLVVQGLVRARLL